MASGWAQTWQVPTKASIFNARVRLGVEPLAELFARLWVPLAAPDTPGSW